MRTHVLLSAFAVFSMFKGDPIGSMGHNVLPHKMLRNVSALRWYGWSVAQAPSLRGPISYGTLTGRLRDKPFEPMPIQTDANSCKSIQNGADPCDLLPIHANCANLFKTASVHWGRCQSTRIHSKCTNQFKPIVSIEIDRYHTSPSNSVPILLIAMSTKSLRNKSVGTMDWSNFARQYGVQGRPGQIDREWHQKNTPENIRNIQNLMKFQKSCFL